MAELHPEGEARIRKVAVPVEEFAESLRQWSQEFRADPSGDQHPKLL